MQGRPAEKKRVVLYSDAVYYGGAEGYLGLLARYLDRDRFQVVLIAPDDPGTNQLRNQVLACGGEIYSLPRPGFRWIPVFSQMVRVLREVKGDVLHINLPSTYDAGLSSIALAARKAGYDRVVSTEHLPMIDRKYKRFPVKVLFSRCIDEVMVAAEATRMLLIRRHGLEPEKIRVIPNGVADLPPLREEERATLRAGWGCAPGQVVVGITGQLTWRKGHHILLRALALALSSPPQLDLRLVVAGGGEEAETLQSLARELGIADRIVWLGRREDGPRLACAYDLLVLPSAVETMPFTILEAMAAGVPVISTTIYGIPEVVVEGETGLLVPPNDIPSLAAALSRLVRRPEERARMGASGRLRYLERFTAEQMASETARVYLGETESGPMSSLAHGAVSSRAGETIAA